MSLEEESPLYPLRPKMHVFHECLHEALVARENPASSWTFQDEDNTRVMVDVAKSCHGSTLESQSLEKWVMQFFSVDDSDASA